jgi:hypothetical protein
MAVDLEAICEELEVDLCLARLRHLAARHRLRLADTPATRAAEAECRAQLDVVLDLLIELKGSRPVRSVRPVRGSG